MPPSIASLVARWGTWGRGSLHEQPGLFRWSARQHDGRLVQGHSRAAGQHHVRALLRCQGLLPLSVERSHPQAIAPRDLVTFTRQLATLLGAGMALMQALQTIGKGLGHAGLAELIDQLRAALEAGLSLSQALRQHPQVFAPVYVHLVEAGEASGQLDVLLERLASDLEKHDALRSRVRAALVYPLVVLGVAVGVLAIIMVAVVPSFESTFAAFGAELPAATRLVMALSRAAVSQGPWWLLLAVVLAGWAASAWRRHERVRRTVERGVLRLPVIGALLHQAALARWSRTLAGLLGGGLPLVDAMASARGAAGLYVYADASVRMREELARGSSLQRALADVGLFPPMVVQMCAAGEESGALDRLLGKVADFHEREVDLRVSSLSSLLEPALILCLGAVIGALVVALYLPIFQMGQIT